MAEPTFGVGEVIAYPKSGPRFIGFYEGPKIGLGPPITTKQGREFSCSYWAEGAYAVGADGNVYALAGSFRPEHDPAKRYWVKIEAEVVDST